MDECRRHLIGASITTLLLVVCLAVHAWRPCNPFSPSFAVHLKPGNDPDHRAPLAGTVVTVFRVRRLGPHVHRSGALPDLASRHHLHSIPAWPANIQIRRTELPELPHPAAGAGRCLHERDDDILVHLMALLFAISFFLVASAFVHFVRSLSALAGDAACPHPHYVKLFGDEESDFDSDRPKKVRGVITPGVEAHDGGKK